MTFDLRRMRFLINRLPAARFNYEKAMSRACKVTAAIDDMPHGSGVGNPVERAAEELEEAEEALKRIREELDQQRRDLSPVIQQLDDPQERTAMVLRYIDGYSGRDIALKLSYSERHIFRVISSAENHVMDVSRKM